MGIAILGGASQFKMMAMTRLGQGSLENIDRVGVSIVLVCYNSKNRILPTLERLANQEGIFFPWEVLVIDNNSSDGTSEIVMEAWQARKTPCELRVIKEPKVGTMHARHRGILAAGFRYLLFCDDDNWLHSTYVKTAFETICRDQAIAAVGGIGILEFEPGFNPPAWVKKYEKSFGAGPQGLADGDTTHDKGCLYTAGAILDRIWLDRLYSLGFESSLKGRDGKSLVAGEDTELTYALKLIGGKLHYSPKMHFKHFMPKGRMTWSYLTKMWKSFGYSNFLIMPYKIHFKNGRAHSLNVLILKRVIAVAKTFIVAAFAFFSEGNRNVLQFYKAIGQLKAVLFKYKTFQRNQQMVATLLYNVKNKRVEKL